MYFDSNLFTIEKLFKLKPNYKMSIINVGLVGHVSNGKTTLVRQLTGVDTKRYASERKRGCSIRLGYASGVIWQCQECIAHYCSGMNTSALECIAKCRRGCLARQKISFVDMPGHQSYVGTMINGANMIDCAIIITDARADSVQKQTLEHLAILQCLDVKNVIVVQNKLDLVSKDQALSHQQMLIRELKSTIAEGKPIIPASIQKGVGINYIVKYLAQMLKEVPSKNRKVEYPGFTVARTFDINQPYCGFSQIRGGVLGGTVVGDAIFTKGVKVRILPDLTLINGSKISLYTQILSMRSEITEVEKVESGGLYALGTRIDPALTKGDRLIGSFVIPASEENSAPPQVDTITIRPHYMKKSIAGTRIGKFKVGDKFSLVFGGMSVIATCQEQKEKFLIVKLNRTICLTHKRFLLYSISQSRTDNLVGFADLK